MGLLKCKIKSEKCKKLVILILVLICIVFSFYRLGDRPLERWDEQTNAWVVEQTISSDSLVVLEYEGKPFFEKPPLWYYSTIGIVKVFGNNNFSLRFISAISNVILFSLIMLFCLRRFNFKVALFAGLTYLTTRHLFVSGPAGIFSTHFARSADLDLLQLLFMFITVYLTVKFEENRKNLYLILIGIFTGLAFMSKGAMSVLPVIILMLWELRLLFIDQDKFNLLKNYIKNLLIFLIPFLVIVVPWHLYLYLKFGNRFISEYLSYHYVNRYVNAIEGHSEGLFFHFNNLLNLEFFSSGYILIAGLFYILIATKLKEFKYFLLFTYSVLVLALITIMQTKLAWYLLYIYPVGVIVCGVFYGVLFDYLKVRFQGVKKVLIRIIY